MSSISAGRDAITIGNARANNIAFHTGDHFHTGAASGSHIVRQDVFRPSFEAPANPREVVLDFGDPHNRAEPQTQEARVLQEILRDDCNECDTRVIVIHGMGGVGKSCMLRALAKHELVKNRFQDGVYFLSLGMDAGIDKLIEGLVEIILISGGRELGRDIRGEGNLQIVLKMVREWLNGKTCLLLVDDFWEENGLGADVVAELTGILSDRSILVLTTRFSAIATKGTEIDIKPFGATSEEAKDMLLRYSKFDWKQLEQERVGPSFDKLLRMCGGLPIFLAIVGKAVAKIALRFKHKTERTSAWERCACMVKDSELLETKVDGYKGLGRTLHMSLKLLSEDCGQLLKGLAPYSLSEMHRAFCVFKKQTAIPVSVCRRLWKVDSDDEALKIGMAFANVGLADIEIERKGDRQVEVVRLHDLIQIFAVKCAKGKGEVTIWHERLLEGYISKAGGRETVRRWWDFEEDSGEEYLSGNLCRHLASSGNVEELAGLLLCGEWTQFRHKHGGLSAWKHDVLKYLGLSTTSGLSEREREIESGMQMVRDTVVESWAVLHENLHELGFQIFGRLIDCKNPVAEKYLESIQEVQCGPWLKPMHRVWKRPGEGGMTAEFHLEGYISDIAVHKDLSNAAVADGREVVVIDLKEMTVISRCIGHTGLVKKVAMSGDGKRVFSLSGDCTVRQWDIQSGKEDMENCKRLEDEESENDDEVTCGAFGPDKSYVITGSRKGKVKVWDLNSGGRIGLTMYANQSVSCIEVSPDGRTAAAGVVGGAVLLWDVQTFTPLWCGLKGHLKEVRSVAFSSDCRFAASVGDEEDGSLIRLWSIENRTEVRGRFSYCEDRTLSIMFSEDDQQIICGQWDGSITVCDVASGAVIHSWKAHSLWVTCVAVCGDGENRYAVSGCGDDIIRVWNLQEAANCKDERIQHDASVSCMAASPDGQFFVSASNDKTMRMWNAVDGTAAGSLCGHEGSVSCVAVSPDSLQLVSGSSDRTVRVWDVSTGVQIGNALQGHKGWVECVAFSRDGRFVVSGSDDCTARVWRVTDSPQIDEDVCEPGTKRVRRAEPEVQELLSCREPLRLEMILNHELEDEEHNSGRWVTSVSMSPDGQRVLSGLSNGEIWVWDVTSGECTCRTRSQNGSRIVEIEISERNEVVTMNWRYEKLRWRLNYEGGLSRGLEYEDESAVAQAEAQESLLCHGLSSIVCDWQAVRLNGSSRKIATLPEVVHWKAWKYDSQRRVLCAGLNDGRVLFFQVQF